MPLDQFERRLAIAIAMAIYIHLTSDIWYGMFTILMLTLCIIFAMQPAIMKWIDKRAAE